MKYKLIVPVFLVAAFTFCSKGGEGVIKAPGLIDGDIISLKSKVSSKIEALFFSEGDRVKKGDVIARLDSRIIEKRIDEIRLRQKEMEVNREKLYIRLKQVVKNRKYLAKRSQKLARLSLKKSVSGDSYERIKLKLSDAISTEKEIEKNIEALKLKDTLLENKRAQLNILLEDYTIKAPAEGILLEKFISEGENIFPGAAIADLLDKGSVYVEIFVEERELGGIKMKMPAKVIADGEGTRTVNGYISYIGSKAEFSPKYVISEKEREALLYRLKISFEDKKGILKIGMPVTVIIDIEN